MATVRVLVDGDLAGVVAQAVAGDEAAFARIIQAHHDDMTRVCFVICGDLDIAERRSRRLGRSSGASWAAYGSRNGCAHGWCPSRPMKRVSLSDVDGAGRSSSFL